MCRSLVAGIALAASLFIAPAMPQHAMAQQVVSPASSDAIVKGRTTSPTSSSSGLQSDTYPRTAAERQSAEADKKLDKAIKGICRGC